MLDELIRSNAVDKRWAEELIAGAATLEDLRRLRGLIRYHRGETAYRSAEATDSDGAWWLWRCILALPFVLVGIYYVLLYHPPGCVPRCGWLVEPTQFDVAYWSKNGFPPIP